MLERRDFWIKWLFVKWSVFEKSVNLYTTVSCSYIRPTLSENKLYQQILMETPNTKDLIDEGCRQTWRDVLCSPFFYTVPKKKRVWQPVLRIYSVWQASELQGKTGDCFWAQLALHEKVWDYTGLLYTLLASDFTRQLVSEQRINYPHLFNVGMKTLGSQLLALLTFQR
jgi:hypothetical protein